VNLLNGNLPTNYTMPQDSTTFPALAENPVPKIKNQQYYTTNKSSCPLGLGTHGGK
jgi:hypothetical protein